MTKPLLKTKAEQKVEFFESLKRPLTDEESNELRRALHATYERKRREMRLLEHRQEELKLLEKLRKEALMESPLS